MSLTEKLFDRLAERIIESNERVRASLEAGFAQTKNAVTLHGAETVTVRTGNQLVPGGGRRRLLGWSLEGGAADATLRILDGRTADAEQVSLVKIAANGVSNHSLPGSGIFLVEGCYLLNPGGITGTLYYGARD